MERKVCMKKKLLTVMISTIVSLSMIVTPVFAAHVNPKTDGKCDNTYTTYSHIQLLGTSSLGEHELSDGRVCNKTRYVYLHEVSCSSCTYVFNRSTAYACTDSHSLCGTHIVNH